MVRSLLLCSLLLLATSPAAAVPTVGAPAAEMRAFQRAHELIEVTGAEEALAASALASLDDQLGALDLQDGAGSSAVQKSFRTLFQDEVLKSLPEVVDALARVWAQHFDEEEIGQLIAFYRTPVGQKVLARMPMVMRQAQAIGARWGERAGRRAMQRLEEGLTSH